MLFPRECIIYCYTQIFYKISLYYHFIIMFNIYIVWRFIFSYKLHIISFVDIERKKVGIKSLVYCPKNYIQIIFKIICIFNWKSGLEIVEESAKKWVKHMVKIFINRVPCFFFFFVESESSWLCNWLLSGSVPQRKFVYCCTCICSFENFSIMIW